MSSASLATAATKYRASTWLPYLILSLACFVCFSNVRIMVIDDGFIAHRYAANLLRGYGMVFTKGQRVEAISDLSWALLMTIPQILNFRPELFGLLLGAISGATALLIAYRTAVVSFCVSRKLALIVVFVAAFNADYWIAVSNGIETGLYTLVVTGGASLLLRRRFFWAGTVLGFAFTLRPESVLLAPTALVCIALAEKLINPKVKLFWHELWANRILLIPWIVFVVGVSSWRFYYYGMLLPNTVIAKSHPAHLRDFYLAAKYIFLFCMEATPWVVLPWLGSIKKFTFAFLFTAVWLGYQLTVITLNGGDWMFGFRFLNCFFPLLVLMSSLGLRNLLERHTARVRFSLAGLALLVVVTVCTNNGWALGHGILNHHELADIIPPTYEPYHLNIARALKPALRSSDVVAPEVLGVVSYTLKDNPMHDWLGLADRYIAHHGTVYFPTFGKANPAYSVNVVTPTVFLFASGASTINIFQQQTHGTFAQTYECWQVSGQPVILAIRRDRGEDLLRILRKSHFDLRKYPVAAL